MQRLGCDEGLSTMTAGFFETISCNELTLFYSDFLSIAAEASWTTAHSAGPGSAANSITQCFWNETNHHIWLCVEVSVYFWLCSGCEWTAVTSTCCEGSLAPPSGEKQKSFSCFEFVFRFAATVCCIILFLFSFLIMCIVDFLGLIPLIGAFQWICSVCACKQNRFHLWHLNYR